MSFGRLVRLGLIVCALLGASSSFAGPQVFLHPVEIVGYEGQDLRLKVLVPCGGELYGIIAHEGPSRELQLAAAVRQNPIICTGVPEPLSIKVGFLDVHRFDSIAALTTGAPKRIDVKPLESLSLGSLDESGATLVASSKGTCGLSLGVLLKPSQEGVLYVGLAGLMRRPGAAVKGGDRQCATRVKETQIHALSPTVVKRVRPLETNHSHVSRQYELRLASVDLASFRVNGDKIHVRYFRACREAPVGLVSKRYGSKSGNGQKFEVGVLLAHYFNAPCSGAAQGEWAELEVPNLPSIHGESLRPVPALKDDERVWLRALASQDPEGRLKAEGQNAVKVAYNSGCVDNGDYLITATTRTGHTAVGVLGRSSARIPLDTVRTAKRCSTLNQEKKWTLVTSEPGNVYALQLSR